MSVTRENLILRFSELPLPDITKQGFELFVRMCTEDELIELEKDVAMFESKVHVILQAAGNEIKQAADEANEKLVNLEKQQEELLNE